MKPRLKTCLFTGLLGLLILLCSAIEVNAKERAMGNYIGDTETTGIFGANEAFNFEDLEISDEAEQDIDTNKPSPDKKTEPNTEVKPLSEAETSGISGANDSLSTIDLEATVSDH